MQLPLYRVDAFSDRIGGGNPAGVCPLEAWLEDELMQAIARENNWSETAFFVRNGSAFDLRWFTPGCEVDLCGHATLASAFIVDTELGERCQPCSFNTRSGELRVNVAGERYVLDLPANELREQNCPPELAAALGMTPLACHRSDDYLLVFENEAQIRAMQPDFPALRRIDMRGVIVTAPGDEDDVDFVSRWFGGPEVGIDEDPVTGSAHCILAPYWAERLDQPRLEARQVSARGGSLSCEMLGDRVLVGGKARLYLRGEIQI